MREQYPANFSEFISGATSTTWALGFTAQIGGIVREVAESFVGFIHLDLNIIEITGSPPLIIIEAIESIVETLTTTVPILTISKAPRGTGVLAGEEHYPPDHVGIGDQEEGLINLLRDIMIVGHEVIHEQHRVGTDTRQVHEGHDCEGSLGIPRLAQSGR